MAEKLSVFWFRRDLRLADNQGLYQALMSGNKVLPIFIFDTEILCQLENKEDRRVDFIFQALNNINDELQKTYKSIQIFHGKPL
ncbi:MAG: deoxyribodipyrimidine photo-lyase [Kaistella sp.]